MYTLKIKQKGAKVMRLGDRTAEAYVLLGSTVFLWAAPFFAAGGGYSRITGFKAAVYAALTFLFLLSALDLPRFSGFFRAPERVLTAAWLLFCLLSALCSPWQRTAFLGGSRKEGFFQLGLYGMSFLLLSLRRPRRRVLLLAFAAGIFFLEVYSLIQLRGYDPLGLYPPGMGWADANLRYAGSYLGTVGNAGQTGAVLTAAAALFFLLILEKGGRSWFLLPLLLLTAWILSETELTAPLPALGAAAFLSLFLCKTLEKLCAWFCVSSLLAAVLLHRFLAPSAGLLLAAMALGAWAFLRLGPGQRPVRLWSLCLGVGLLCLALLFFLTYRGWYTPLLEGRDLLRGQVREEMGSGRVFIWKQVLSKAWEHPFLGTGPDTLALRELTPYSYFSGDAGRTVTLSIDAAHNEVLQTLICCGLPAALCHLGLFVCAAIRFFREKDGRRACAGGAMAYAVQAMFGISMCASAPVFWVLLALSIPEGGGQAAKAQHTDEPK